MIPKPIETITIDDLIQLIANGVREDRQIEFKQVLPGNTDDEKKEFLADVTSFANSSGGEIIYGMRAEQGLAKEITGVSVPDTDAEILRLSSMIRDGIQPRITGVQIRPVSDPKGVAFVLRIPDSWAKPHMVTFKGQSRFFIRSSAGKHQMDVSEIRSAFALSEEIPERIRRFRDERFEELCRSACPRAGRSVCDVAGVCGEGCRHRHGRR